LAHQIKVTKTRCSRMDNATGVKPGPQFWQPLFDWMQSAAPVEAPAAPTGPQTYHDDKAHVPAGQRHGGSPESAPALTTVVNPPDPQAHPTAHKLLADKIVACETIEQINALRPELREAVTKKKVGDKDALHLKSILDGRIQFINDRDAGTKST
ncbi:MAG TPA: hypothetical protein VGE74_20005, partial [Gemmata sp.]